MPTGTVTDARGAIAFVRNHGIVLMSARGPAPSLAEAIAGAPIRGSWWGHPKSKLMFDLFNAVSGAPEVLVCRLAGGKVTFVHERLWPALARLARRFDRRSLAAVREEHTEAGRHRTIETPFARWVPARVKEEAAGLSESEAIAAIGAELYAAIRRPAAGRRTRALLAVVAIAFAANSTRETISRLAGAVDADRSTWTSDDSSAPRHLSRVISERLEKGRWRRSNFVSEDGGETWRLLFTDELERGASERKD